ncbi:glycosyltransferase involved in cell wall biosynthesis [Pullulanibacillus pueri]|uniref:Glycosyl transferase family 1 domain-containing protein n=1 Tax=Pullulanibacillus pueri TaxID=1437324 RepID=A0A8J3EKS5_9BACL|nr:glycosyltransferase [Pullulanibacillus pueri]MBM7683624.1 glycosyltransferase involved in cell wall biosynthesis [Pullulanibacillus pueri]GGH76596.1 hypothetical protein GCM10007096_07260 [Pullulanibacillus pueri]
MRELWKGLRKISYVIYDEEINSIKTNSDPTIEQYLFLATSIENLEASQINNIISLYNSYRVPIKVLFLNYDKDFDQKVKSLEEKWNLDFSSVFVNMYRFYRSSGIKNNLKIKPIYSEIDEPGFSCFEQSGESNVYLYYDNLRNQYGDYKKKTFNDENILRSIEYFDEETNLKKIEEFDELGYLQRSVHFRSGKVWKEMFFDVNGDCFLTKMKNFKSKKNKLQITLFNRIEKIAYKFNNVKELRYVFLDEFVDNKMTIIASNEPNDFIENYYNEYVYKVCFIKDEISIDSINRDCLSLYDGVFFSTKLKKDNVINKYGKRNNLFVIPPFFTNIDKVSEFSVSRNYKHVLIRLREIDSMQLEQVIRAFRITVDKVPSARLTIYGLEMLDERSEELVKSLELNNNIVLISEEDEDINYIYKLSGFSLSLAETQYSTLDVVQSLSNGCPVVAYNNSSELVEIIKNGMNGYLVKSGSISGLGNKIVELLLKPEMVDRMSEEAINASYQYTETNFFEKFNYAMKEIVRNFKYRTNITDMLVYMLDSGWRKEKEYFIKNRVTLTGVTNDLSEPRLYMQLFNRNNNKIVIINTNVNKVNNNIFESSGSINFPSLDLSQGIWDVAMCLEWGNSFFKKRVGHFKADVSEISTIDVLVNNRVITPYFTEKGDNLSFKVGRFITDED